MMVVTFVDWARVMVRISEEDLGRGNEAVEGILKGFADLLVLSRERSRWCSRL